MTSRSADHAGSPPASDPNDTSTSRTSQPTTRHTCGPNRTACGDSCGTALASHPSRHRASPHPQSTDGSEPDATQRRWELGATSHGPTAAHLAERLCKQIRAWDHDRTAQPTITAYPATTPNQDLTTGIVIDKQFTRLVIAA